MNFNTILYRFGLEPNNFDNRLVEPIKTEDGYLYELFQADNDRTCPHCGNQNNYKHNYFYTETSCCINEQLKETLRIKKIRYKCRKCGKTFTHPIVGIDSHNTITKQVRDMVRTDFFKMLSFKEIADRYNLSTARIIQLFDEIINFVPRKPLPRTLCIDEKKFKDSKGSKYVCILYDFENKDIVDVIKSRQLAYLNEYFNKIPEKERENVKYFVCDMYDGYATIQRKFFPNSTFIIDLFHITRQLTETVNSLRVSAMNRTNKSSIRYKFMKKYWKYFLCRKEDIPNNFMSEKGSIHKYHFDDLIFDCLKYDDDLRISYSILQDFYHYYLKRNYDDALKFIEFISNRCINSNIPKLVKVGETFFKWKYGIANTISRSQNKFHPSNSAAENMNNHIETLIRISYGYKNFERFRKRIMLIKTYKNG